MNEKKIFTLGTARELGPSTSTLIQSIAEKDLVEKVVVLPDLHHKSNMEFPSSTAVAVRGGIVPHLTSNSINCGMALVRTNLMAKDLREGLCGPVHPILQQSDTFQASAAISLVINNLVLVLLR